MEVSMKQKGFTLLEILAVVTILGLIVVAAKVKGTMTMYLFICNCYSTKGITK